MKKLLLIPFAFCIITSYLLSQGVWTQKANFGGTARSGAVGFSIGTKGYIGTGTNASGLTKDFWEWDQITNTWTQKISFGGTARAGAVGFSIGTKGYIGTGVDANGMTNDFWEWDQATNIWLQKTNFGGSTRDYAVGFSIGTKGYLGTGYDTTWASYNLSNDFWEWNQTTNIWLQKTNFGGITRGGAIGFAMATKGYIGTGGNGNGNDDMDFWEYCDTCSGAGVKETDLENLISVYPNPSNGKFTIETLENKNFIARITNPLGQKVAEKKFEKRIEVDVSGFGKGLFLVEVCSPTPNPSPKERGTECHTEKVMIE
ncbi:MAG: T9SS type A sorting domain-containing protein [Bacteroidetes bacterium]|nr:T9SS type A sorting domain-containing protein [Bacteroidota bacterium]